MNYPKSQELQSLNLRDYTNRIIVAGTRGYNDRLYFHNTMIEYLDRFNSPVIFISGAAASGADRLIIEWCAKFNYPCMQFPADWDLGKGAGFIRNEEMADVATHLLAFYNGSSPGTHHMINVAQEHGLQIRVIKT
jgi:hypothetical protein